MVGNMKGHQVQICSYYPPEVALELKKLATTTRITLAVYLREAAEDLLRKYADVREKNRTEEPGAAPKASGELQSDT